MFKEQWSKGSTEYNLIAKGERKEDAKFVYKMEVYMHYYTTTTSLKKKIRLIRDMEGLAKNHFNELVDQIMPWELKE